MQFFGQRMAADIADRQATNAAIAGTLVNTFAPLALNTLMMLFYLVAMLKYSVPLTAIGILAIIINMGMSFVISPKRVNLTRVQMRDNAKLSSATASNIRMIETIKASGAEKGVFGRWAGFQASVNTQQYKYIWVNTFLSAAPAVVTSLTNMAVLGAGVYLVLHGSFTVGMVMAFQGFMSSFMAPANKLIAAGQSFQEMITQMERVDDVMSYPTDPYLEEKPKTEEYQKLTGAIEMNCLWLRAAGCAADHGFLALHQTRPKDRSGRPFRMRQVDAGQAPERAVPALERQYYLRRASYRGDRQECFHRFGGGHRPECDAL